MAYEPRIEAEGCYYHLTANAVSGEDLYRAAEDRLAFLRILGREIEESEWRCLMYCLMGTHLHLVIKLEKCTLSSGMQRLTSAYARAFNRQYGRRGALVQRRFHHRLIKTTSHLLEANRYVARNPVRAGICERPQDYVWCSYGATIADDDSDPLVDEDELLGLFGTRPEEARRRLRAFVDEPDPRKRRAQTPLGHLSEDG